MAAPSFAEFRAQVEKELRGAAYETLTQKTAEGLQVAPLYVEAPPEETLVRDARARPFRVCMRHGAGATIDAIAVDLEGGADACWLPFGDAALGALDRADAAGVFFVLEPGRGRAVEAVERLAARAGSRGAGLALLEDPLGRLAAGLAPAAELETDLAAMARAARRRRRPPRRHRRHGLDLAVPRRRRGRGRRAGLRAVDRRRVPRALIQGGADATRAADGVAFQLAVGRETFTELCKLRALRTCWLKVLSACGADGAARTLLHAVSSARTLAQRDPWVNMLRVTTQVFAAALGGAELVTPAPYDQALGAPSALGRRVARNTGLVLREERALGRVVDPAGGSCYLETLTDALARGAWRRFQELARGGGIAKALASGALKARLADAWRARLERIAKRKTPILGVSEFADRGEPARRAPAAPARPAEALPAHRDAEPFERLRDRADASAPPEVLLVTLGTYAESRARVGFAAGLFAAGGLRTREVTVDEPAPIACPCGTDARYAAEAATRARAPKEAGCGRVLLAGRPGALEPALRDAGVDGFLFVGCDAAALLSELLEVTP